MLAGPRPWPRAPGLSCSELRRCRLPQPAQGRPARAGAVLEFSAAAAGPLGGSGPAGKVTLSQELSLAAAKPRHGKTFPALCPGPGGIVPPELSLHFFCQAALAHEKWRSQSCLSAFRSPAEESRGVGSSLGTGLRCQGRGIQSPFLPRGPRLWPLPFAMALQLPEGPFWLS